MFTQKKHVQVVLFDLHMRTVGQREALLAGVRGQRPLSGARIGGPQGGLKARGQHEEPERRGEWIQLWEQHPQAELMDAEFG